MDPGDDYLSGPAILIFADDPADRAIQTRLAHRLEGRVVAAVPLAEAAERLDEVNVGVVVLAARADPGPLLDRLLDRLDLAARDDRYQSVVSVSPDLIDVAAARAPHLAILSEADESELVAALAVALAAASPIAAAVGEDRATTLRSLSEEVGRIAKTLAALSGEGGLSRPPVGNVPAEEHPPVSAKRIRAEIRARRLREHFFANDLFADPAWDMLLDLAASRIEGRQVAVSSLCIAAAVPPTTALRWIKTLTDEGLFVRVADPNDGRRIFIGLSETAMAGMIAYFLALQRVGSHGARAG